MSGDADIRELVAIAALVGAATVLLLRAVRALVSPIAGAAFFRIAPLALTHPVAHRAFAAGLRLRTPDHLEGFRALILRLVAQRLDLTDAALAVVPVDLRPDLARDLVATGITCRVIYQPHDVVARVDYGDACTDPWCTTHSDDGRRLVFLVNRLDDGPQPDDTAEAWFAMALELSALAERHRDYLEHKHAGGVTIPIRAEEPS